VKHLAVDNFLDPGPAIPLFRAHPAAIVSSEHPSFANYGLGVIVIGFVMQFFAAVFPPKPTLKELREQLRLAKARRNWKPLAV